MIPAILIMGIGPILSWGKEDKLKVLKKIAPSLILTFVMTLFIFFIYQSYSLIGVIGIILSFWIISNNLFLVSKKIKNSSYGMIIAHIGIGLLILGITGSSVWQKEKIVKMKINDEISIDKYKVKFNKIEEISAQNYVAISGNFVVSDNKKNVITKLNPENRFYPITGIFTTEASIHTNLLRDLYIVMGDGNKEDGWVIKIYHNPLVIWIWIGSITIFLGGLVSLKNNLKKQKI